MVESTTTAKSLLKQIVAEANAVGTAHLTLHQQDKIKEHISIRGAVGTLWIEPRSKHYDISLSGKVLEAQLYGPMSVLCGAECNGYKQTNQTKGTKRQPYWRVDDLGTVKSAIFLYAGISAAAEDEIKLAEEVDSPEHYIEGATVKVTVNSYERNPAARRRCIEHHGAACAVCSIDFGQSYGTLGEGFIHIHHKIPLADIGEEYLVNPVEDLVPVCPNCHAMLHRVSPALSVEELRTRLKDQPNKTIEADT